LAAVAQPGDFAGLVTIGGAPLMRYPPDQQERAAQTVVEQAELLSESWAA
jgi:hypothetical protein